MNLFMNDSNHQEFNAGNFGKAGIYEFELLDSTTLYFLRRRGLMRLPDAGDDKITEYSYLNKLIY
jgi:hypothetical protein